MSTHFKIARGLGWSSFAIGAVELFATSWLEDTLGIDDHHTLLRAFAAREMAAGATILAKPGLGASTVNGMWARVAGDAVDLACLGAAIPSTRNPRGLFAVLASVAAITALDINTAAHLQRNLLHAKSAARNAHRKSPPPNALPYGATQVQPAPTAPTAPANNGGVTA